MDYLMRDDAPLTDSQWAEIDAKVIAAAKAVLTGRRFLDIYGPLGSGIQMLEVPSTQGGPKKATEIPLLSTDFTQIIQLTATLRATTFFRLQAVYFTGKMCW